MSLEDEIRKVLSDPTNLPQEFLNYLIQHATLNPQQPGASIAPSINPTGLGDAVKASRYVGATTSGHPTTGYFQTGDWIIDRSGSIWICIASGAPGTWVNLGGSTAFPGAWQVAQPVAPASNPSGGVSGASFLNGWANIAFADGTYSPLRYRQNPSGDVEIVGAISGGAFGSACIQLPLAYRPADDVFALISSTDGTRALAVEVQASSGNVIPLAEISITPSSAPPTGAAGGDLTGTYPNPTIGANKVTEGKIGLSDVTTDNVTSSAHGFAPKSPADATQFLNGATTPAFAQVKDSDLSTSDITTNNASTSKHGFLKKLDNVSTHFMDGTGNWSTPSGSGGASPLTTKGDIWGFSSVDARIPVGANGNVLTADSTQTLGVKWGAPVTGITPAEAAGALLYAAANLV